MSYLYDDPQAQAQLSDTLDRQPAVPRSPSFFSNFWGATASGAAIGALKVGEAATYFQDPEALMGQMMYEGFTGSNRDVVKEDMEARALAREAMARKAKELTPNPLVTGTGSQIMSGLAQILPTAVAGGAATGPVGAAMLVGLSQGVGDYQESTLEGVDSGTAAKKALLTGVTTGVGVVIPMAKPGASLLANMGIGATVNVATGATQRAGSAAILESGGYHEMAAQYKVLDAEAITIDTVLGMAFGGMAHLHGRPSRDQVDAALKLNERQHAEIEAQPGLHRTPDSRDAGTQAFDETLHSLVTGEHLPDLTEQAARLDIQPDPKAQEFYAQLARDAEAEMPKGELAEPRQVDLPLEERPVPEPAPIKTAGEPRPAEHFDVRPIEAEQARQILQSHPDLVLPGPDGTPVRLQDLLNRADEQIAAARKDAALYDVAVACFLRG